MSGIEGYGLGALSLLALTAFASLIGLFVAPALIRFAAFRPYRLIRNAEYWRLISSGFVHANFSHLFFNLLTFYFFAFTLEARIGTLPFVALYALGLLIGNLSTWLRHHTDPDYATVGASGAVSAVLFAAIVYYPRMRLYILPLPVPIPALLFAVLYLAYSYYQARQVRAGVNHDAHIGGALTGLVFVALFEPGAYERLFIALQAMSSSG
ncbi:MAG TPA: rhomboid family intramembrane serine protease [Steroidobacteraceae bacterium]|nr:rhomboid family intramembrane serine protease [Steroidobacteraceae bacterium]